MSLSDHDIDALDELTRSRGFQLLQAHAGQEHGAQRQVDRIRSYMKQGSGTTPAEITAASDAVLELLRWPSEEVAELRKQQASATQSAGTVHPISRRA